MDIKGNLQTRIRMFTIQQVQEIARKLSSMSKKDSDFKPLDTWTSLSKDDYIAFVKNGSNRSVTIDQLYTYIRQNINGDIGDALQRIEALEEKVAQIDTTLNTFIGTTNTHLNSIDESLEKINETLNILTTKYTITVLPVTPNSTVFINGVRQNSLKVTSGSTVNVKVKAEGYDTYEEFVLVEGDIVLNPNLDKEQVTFTIEAIPTDCTIRLNGVVRRSITVEKGTLVTWEVSKAGFITKSGSEVVENSYTLQVSLDVIESDEVNFTINVISPPDAVVTINDNETTSVTVKKGSNVTWSVEAPHYESQSGSQTVTEDTVKNITLVAEKVTLTINPTPADAVVKLNDEVRRSITVDYNTSVNIKASKDGYKDYEEDYVVTQTETKDISLVGETSWSDLVLTQSEESPNPIGSVPYAGGSVEVKATVTVHYSDSTTESRDVTSLAQWSVSGEGCTSGGNGQFTWAENTDTEQRTATITCTATGPGSSNLSETIQTVQIGSNEFLELIPAFMEFESSGGQQELQIETNTSWSIE